MSDRRAVSAGHHGASSVAAANETWRVAVGGNRVESMTVEQIAYAFHAGQLNVRTPLWPPGTTGWQALGNFEQFQMSPAAYGGGAQPSQLAQFEEADDDPTRMWTGAGDIELPGMEAMPPQAAAPLPPQGRPSARTGPRLAAAPSRPSRAAPTASVQPRVAAAAAPSSIPPFRQGRGNGLLLVAGLVGLVGLGSAILAARGNWSASASTSEAPASETAAVAAPAPAPAQILADPASAHEAKPDEAAPEVNEAQLAKYEDTRAPAFVAGGDPARAKAKEKEDEATPTAEAKAELKAEAKAADEPAVASGKLSLPSAEKATKSVAEKPRVEAPVRSRAAVRATPKRAAPAAVAEAPAAAPKAKPKPAEPAAETQPAANASVNEAAAAALATSASLASSCRPRGGPSGAGKARVIYSQDGEVQSVEILTAKFRDTLTGSCVRMVFRRAKIPAFKGEPPTFIKSFTIPDE